MGISHKDFKKKLLKDPEVRKEHEAMKILLTRQGGIRGGIEGLLVEYCNCDSGVHCNWANALNDGVVGEILSYLHSRGVAIKVKCPNCEWSQFGGESVGMTPCYSCNSTGYIIEPLVGE